MITEKNVNDLLKKYTSKQFLDMTDIESEFLDYRSKVIVANIHIERLMDFLIIKKSKNYVDLVKLSFSQKQKILYKLGILDDYLNHELKIVNQIRNAFAHEINPLEDKIPEFIKKFKFYDETKIPKVDSPTKQAGTDGMILGMITGFLMRCLVETLWGINSKKKDNNNN